MRLVLALMLCALLTACGVQGSLSLPGQPAPVKKPASGVAQVVPNAKKPAVAPAPGSLKDDETLPSIYMKDNFFTEDADGNYDIRGESSEFK